MGGVKRDEVGSASARHGANLPQEPCRRPHPIGSQLCQAWRKGLLKLAENGLSTPGLLWLDWWAEAGRRLWGMKGIFPGSLS